MIPPDADPNDPIQLAAVKKASTMLTALHSLKNNPMAEAAFDFGRHQKMAQVEKRRREIEEELNGTPGPLPKQREVKALIDEVARMRTNPKRLGSGMSQQRVNALIMDTGITYFGEPRYFSKSKLEDLKPDESGLVRRSILS